MISPLGQGAAPLRRARGPVPRALDEDSGYRHYEVDQFEQARLIAALRRLDLPLAEIKEVLALDPPAIAQRIVT